MRAKAGLLILLGLFLIIGTVSAYVADSDSSTITSGNSWPVANGADTSIITVTALNKTGGAVPLATVTFSLTGYDGTLSTVTAPTDSAGKATTTFKTKTKSGTAIITATITSSDAMGSLSVPLTLNQNVDHDKAVNVFFNNPPELPTGSTLTLVITLIDLNGNLVDNKNPAETHAFNLYMTPAEGRGFWDGSGYSLITTTPPLQTDSFGNASIDLRIANVTGTNMIFMEKIGSISHTPKTSIEGVAIQDPAYMVVAETVPSDSVYANGVDYFQLSYYVYDPLMNPINGTVIHIVTSDGEVLDKESVDGLIYLEYGKKSEAQTNTLTLTSSNTTMLCQPGGTTGFCSQDVVFVEDEPVDLLLIGSPSSLSSLDQASGTKEGLVRAIVVDPKGNPVPNEDVTFLLTIETAPPYRIIDGGPYDESIAPSLTTIRSGASLTNKTKGGSALAFFKPGAFVTSGSTFSGSATGNATVTATWGSVTKSTRFTWKNYPTLSVKIPADTCKDAHVGDIIDLNISVFGDGAALAPNPVDAMLCMDSSGSMDWTITPPGGKKMDYTKAAGVTFVEAMNEGTDSIGLSYFNNSAGVPVHLSTDFDGVKKGLASLKPGSGTSTRRGLKLALDDVKTKSTNPKAVKAVILLTDGAYNTGGDPLARNQSPDAIQTGWFSDVDGNWVWYKFIGQSGTGPALADDEQDLSNYARKNNIRIYTITLGDAKSWNDRAVQPAYVNISPTWQCYDTMEVLAESTGGFHRHATDGSKLADIYTEIAGDLSTEAGGDAEIKLKFNAKDGTTGNPLPGGITAYMDYMPPSLVADSTRVTMVNGPNPPIYDYIQDDTDNWTKGLGVAPELDIKAGTMNLNDLWTVNFKVNLTKAGNIQLFGQDDPNSEVCFTDVKTHLPVCTKIEALNCPIKEDVGGGFNDEKVTIAITQAASLGADPSKLTVKWSTTYVGDGTVVQTLSYKNLDITNPVQQYATAYTISVSDGSIPPPPASKSFQTTLDTSSWAPGRYSIKVVGSSAKGGFGSDDESWRKEESGSTVYLKLE